MRGKRSCQVSFKYLGCRSSSSNLLIQHAVVHFGILILLEQFERFCTASNMAYL